MQYHYYDNSSKEVKWVSDLNLSKFTHKEFVHLVEGLGELA
jgi:hypothetical protein